MLRLTMRRVEDVGEGGREDLRHADVAKEGAIVKCHKLPLGGIIYEIF